MEQDPVFFSEITYFGKPARVGCDAKCNKAFGSNVRQFVGDLDDGTAEWLADDELGEAPKLSGIIEGNQDKPQSLSEAHNKWCVEQCERSLISEMDKPLEPLDLPDFSKRVPF